MVARLGFESARTADPLAWVDVSDRLRGFEIARGGENEGLELDAGTCSVILDKCRELDPFASSTARAAQTPPVA